VTHEAREARPSGRAGQFRVEGFLNAALGAPPAGGAPQLRLRSTIEVFPARSGEIYLLRPDGGSEFVVRDPTPEDRQLILALASAPIRAEHGGLIWDRLAPLVEAGIVIAEKPGTPLTGTDRQRFDRQLPYLGEFGDPSERQRRLRTSTVVVLGCGGLGTWSLAAIASLGIGRLVLVDDDRVDMTNLNRQILYRLADVGDLKVSCAARWVRRFDPEIEVCERPLRIRAPEDVAKLLDGSDVVLQFADWPAYEVERWVNSACVDAGIPHISAAQQPPLLRIGPTYVPGDSACFECQERGIRRGFPLYEELTARRRDQPRPATTLGPASGIVGTVVAMETLHLFLGLRPLATQGQAMMLDLRTLRSEWAEVARDPDCPVCGHVSPSPAK
jgi:bacteriocin biosynthesis cyclodehydratase domain-containing protein